MLNFLNRFRIPALLLALPGPGFADDTRELQALLGSTLVVATDPARSYAVDGRLTVPAGRTLVFQSGLSLSGTLIVSPGGTLVVTGKIVNAGALKVGGSLSAPPTQVFFQDSTRSARGTVTFTVPGASVHPEWWGADPTGSEGATTLAAIQAANASLTKGGEVIYRGNYAIRGGHIELTHPRVQQSGRGGASITRELDGGGSTLDKIVFYDGRGLDHLAFRDLTLVGGGIHLDPDGPAAGLLIQGCTIKDIVGGNDGADMGHGLKIGAKVSSAKVLDNVFRNIDGNGILAGGPGLLIRGNHFHDMGKAGGGSHAIYLAGKAQAGKEVRPFLVEGNLIDGSRNVGIQANNGARWGRIAGNLIGNCNQGGIHVGCTNTTGIPALEQVQVSGNTIHDCGWGILIGGYDTSHCRNLAVADNQIHGMQLFGISIGHCANVTVHQNRLTRVLSGTIDEYPALQLAGLKGLHCAGNTILDSAQGRGRKGGGGAGISVSRCSSGKVADNFIAAVPGAGIREYELSGIEFSGNTVATKP